MGREKKVEQRQDQFTKWVKQHCDLPAWKALTFHAREAYHRLKIRCMAETAAKNRKVTNNNGSVFVSSRVLAEELGCSQKTAMAAFADLQAKGWIVRTKPSQLGVEGRGTAAHFRLTMLDMGSGATLVPATRDPVRWKEGQDYPVLEFKKSKPKPRRDRAKNISPHPNRAQACTPFGRSNDVIDPPPASYSGAVGADLDPSPAPYSGAYLITIGEGLGRERIEALKRGKGLCGKAAQTQQHSDLIEQRETVTA